VALIAAVLAPTDAALGEAVFKNKSVPDEVRQTLTVESGLNDGLALPIILFLASLTATTALTTESHAQLSWLWFGLSQVGIGLLVGVSLGWLSGYVFLYAASHKLSSEVFEGIGVLALAGVSYLVAYLLGGNGFIAAFVSGLTFGNIVKNHCRFIYKFTESEGQILVWSAFTIIGLGLLPNAISHLSLPVVAYIFVSLFAVRPFAIYISLLGTKTSLATRVFMGWFGPRGLATALFALLVSRQILGEHSEAVLIVAINAVWISTLLHGISAAPAAKWYGTRMRSKSSD